MRKLSIIIAIFGLNVACSIVSEKLDAFDDWTFKKSGVTIFGSASALSLKEVHLAGSQLADQSVVVEGLVAKYNDLGTYLILRDQDARMLIVLTDLIGIRTSMNQDIKSSRLQVLGTVERGSEGLPYIKARSLRAAKI